LTAAILLAAGKGERFGDHKQFLEIAPGKRLVDVALSLAYAVADQVILVLPLGYRWDGPQVDGVATGGRSRLESVLNGLAMVEPNTEIVLVHDAVHPLASIDTAKALIEAIRLGADAAIPLLALRDVVKRVRRDGSIETVGRDDLRLAQVPQAFSLLALRKAHGFRSGSEWEDSQLVERLGGKVTGIPGDPRNLHVVTPDDLALVRCLYSLDR
jgi:2-C-methyl-D-erythritol 4-phosphate cytidylyltransferase